MTSASAAHEPRELAPYDRDEALIATARSSGGAQLAVYPHAGRAVVVGRGGDPDVETRPAVIAADGVPLLRRRGGGCAVVLDEGNLVVSLALPMAGIGGITGAFTAITRWLVAGLADSGVPSVVQAGVSDLALGDRKLGGSCIWRTRGLVYYTTTLLVCPAWDLITRYLPHPPREPAYRRGREHRAFLTCLEELGLEASPAAFGATLLPVLTARLNALMRAVGA